MTTARRKGTAVLLACVALCALWSYSIRQASPGTIKMVDLGALYYGARCVLHHSDPYDPAAFLREFQADQATHPPQTFSNKANQMIVTYCINLPTSLLLLVPLALLPWAVAQNLWMVLIAGLLALAASLMWDLGASASPPVWACLAGFLLLNWELPLVIGNLAGVAVSFCIIAVWCILRGRFVWAGVALLALSLVMKPQDAGFIWLYLLLAGRPTRKPALQALAVAVVLGLCAAAWIHPLSPHWVQELHHNLIVTSAPGAVNYAGPSGASNGTAGLIIALQGTFSILWENARFYNLAAWLIAGSMIVAWAITVLRRPVTPEGTRLALATIAVLTLLPVYHRPDDAVLLLLTIPACAMLFATAGKKMRWLALAFTSAGIAATSGVPLALLVMCARKLHVSASTVPGKLALVFFLRPTPLVLLAVAGFFLWVFVTYKPRTAGEAQLAIRASEQAAASAT